MPGLKSKCGGRFGSKNKSGVCKKKEEGQGVLILKGFIGSMINPLGDSVKSLPPSDQLHNGLKFNFNSQSAEF